MPKTPIVLAHWAHLIGGLEASTLQFYDSVEQALKRRRIPNTNVTRVDWNEGGVLSAKREYLRVIRGRNASDICGAPFGDGFFVSNWLIEERNSLSILELGAGFLAWAFIQSFITYNLGFGFGFLALVFGTPTTIVLIGLYLNETREGWDDFVLFIPILGPIYERLIRPQTYYKVDTAEMFRQAVHSAVMEVVDGMMEAKGMRMLSESERKPVMKLVA